MCSIIGYLGSSISAQALRTGFDKTVSRGPDDTRMLHIGAATLGFHRLAIMGLHPEGMQPFTRDGSALVCNGEIYGFRPIRERLIAEGETFESESDCEILLPLYEREGLDMFRGLDAEFAMTPSAAVLLRRVTRSASARCTTATTPRARSSLPARRKTLSVSCTM